MATQNARPQIFDYDSLSSFVQDMLAWRRQEEPNFAVRKAVEDVDGCSEALVSQIVRGRRSLTRDRVGAFSRILQLNASETNFLDQWVAKQRQTPHESSSRPPYTRRRVEGLLEDWLNLFVREASRLRSFRPDPFVVHRLLNGISSIDHIRRSLHYLLHHGFLQKTDDGECVLREDVAFTEENTPNRKRREFAKRSLTMAARAVDQYPPEARHNDSYLLTINLDRLQELKSLLSNFTDEIEKFERAHPDDDEALYQVLINLTPVGGHKIPRSLP